MYFNKVEIRKRLVATAKQFRKSADKKDKLLSALKEKCRCEKVIAYFKTSGEILTYCTCCGEPREYEFSSTNIQDLKERKIKVRFLDFKEFNDAKDRIFRKLGIENEEG